MSRLFAEYLMNTKNIDKDQLSVVFDKSPVPIYGQYLKYKKLFEFRVLDFYGYAASGGSDVFFYNVKIFEGDLLRMLRVDNYGEDEKNELYYHQLLDSHGGNSGVEQGELDDDVYWGISILQYFFHISTRTLSDMKTAVHLFKLYKRPDKKVLLKKRVLHSKGGRPLGSGAIMTETDIQNFENLDAIIHNCVVHDWYDEFMDLHRVLIRFHKTDLTLTGAKWKFYILRYQYKVSQGFASIDPEWEKELISKNEKYRIFDNLVFHK